MHSPIRYGSPASPINSIPRGHSSSIELREQSSGRLATLQAPLSAMARVNRIRNKTPEMQAGIDAVLSDARHSLSMRVKLLEQRLDGRDFLVAGRMTLADISVGYPPTAWESPISPRYSVE